MKFILAIVFSLTTSIACAGEWSGYLGSDWTHGTGTPGQKKIGEVRYSTNKFDVYTGANDAGLSATVSMYGSDRFQLCGGGHLHPGRWLVGLDLCYGEADEKVDTDWRFQFRASWRISRSWSAEYIRIFNQDLVPLSDLDQDTSYNFVGARYTFGRRSYSSGGK